jgi:hypothetical protein
LPKENNYHHDRDDPEAGHRAQGICQDIGYQIVESAQHNNLHLAARAAIQIVMKNGRRSPQLTVQWA